MKRCGLCGETKSLGEFHKNAKRCKPCAIAKARESYQRNRDAVREAGKDPEYKARANAKRRERYAKDPSKVYARNKRWQEENRDKYLDSMRSWYRSNADKVKQTSKEWLAANPDYARAKVAERRAWRNKATPGWANRFFIREIYDLAVARERVCGGKWHVDHVVPLKSELVCGLHVEHNLRVIPASENIAKSNRFWPDMP